MAPIDVACRHLLKLYPDEMLETSSSAYHEACMSFWSSRQQELRPAMIFQPSTAEHLRRAMVEIVARACPFAIKGGGHSSNVQGSCVENGLLVDLARLSHLEIMDDGQAVKLGPGLRWATVYERLQQQGLTTVGGRDATVGVPGFVFGGGLSNYGTMYGWGFDALLSVDMVLADARLITVDADNHGDLFTALHGGGAHNFGIVTSLTLRTFPYQTMYGGTLHHDPKHLDEYLAAYDIYSQSFQTDGKAHLILDISRPNGSLQYSEYMAYPEPTKAVVYEPFLRIPSIENTLRYNSGTELAAQVHSHGESTGKRNMYWNHTFVYDLALLKSLFDTFLRLTESSCERFSYSLQVNHLTDAHRYQSIRNGGRNVLGLDTSDQMLINVIWTCVWQEKSDDVEVESIMQEIGVELERVGRATGKYVDFKYMNYAHRSQDVVGSYGRANKDFLKMVASIYDPTGVFQRLQMGGFKLEKGENGFCWTDDIESR